MDEIIQDYNLNPDDNISDHDTMCMEQAGKLVQIGYLEYEIAAYGTAVYRDNDIYYYISAKEESVEKFIEQCYLQGLYPTPAKYFFKRYDLLHQSEEEIRKEFRLYVAEKLQEAYPKNFFGFMRGLTANVGTNAAWPLLQEMTRQLEGCFDLKQLKIFENLIKRLLPARLLTVEGYHLLKQWLNREYEKLAIEPTKAGVYQRTYAGFSYRKKNGEIGYFVDAFPYMAHEKQVGILSYNYLATPILTCTYFADSYTQLNVIKEAFKNELKKYCGKNYLDIMGLLKELPTTVDNEKYNSCLEILKQEGEQQAVETMLYYGCLWNVSSQARG